VRGHRLKLEIARDGVIPDAIVLKVGTSGADQPRPSCGVQDAKPTIANGEVVSLTFEPTEPVEKLVRLTAYTEKGCVVTLEQLINIAKIQG